MRLPRVRHADRDPLHGGARVRRPPSHDLQDFLPAAAQLGAPEPGGAAGEHAGARGGRRQGDAQRQLVGVQQLHHQREDERQGVGSVLSGRSGKGHADQADQGGVVEDVPVHVLARVRFDFHGDAGRDVRVGEVCGAQYDFEDDHQ